MRPAWWIPLAATAATLCFAVAGYMLARSERLAVVEAQVRTNTERLDRIEQKLDTVIARIPR